MMPMLSQEKATQSHGGLQN